MSDNDVCIFCESAPRGSKEHIIPESLGNRSLITYALCEACNIKLGRKIDKYINQMGFVNLYREIFSVRGKTGNIPTLLSHGKDKSGHQVSFSLSDGFKWGPFLEENEDGLFAYGGSKQKVLESIKKHLIRNGVETDKIATTLDEVTCIPVNNYLGRGGVNFHVIMEPQNSFLFILKIAYEYAHFRFGEQYLNDKVGICIRSCLLDALSKDDINDIQNFYVRHSDFMDEFLDTLSREDHKGHLLGMFKSVNNALMLYISLFMCPALSYEVLLSENAEQYSLDCDKDSVDFLVINI